MFNTHIDKNESDKDSHVDEDELDLDSLKSTIAHMRKTLDQLEQQALTKGGPFENPKYSNSQKKLQTEIPECNFPHDSVPETIDRGIVGVVQEKNTSKTDEQRNRAKKKALKKQIKSKNLNAIIPPY